MKSLPADPCGLQRGSPLRVWPEGGAREMLRNFVTPNACRLGRAHFLLAIAAALALTSGAARAAPLTSVSYSVTGGSFNGLFSSGPITSGALTFTPMPPVSTPFSAYEPGTWNLALLGPSGSFQVTLVGSAFVFSPAHTFDIYGFGPFQPIGAVVSNGNSVTAYWTFFTFAAPTRGYSTNVVRGSIPCCDPCPDCGTPVTHGFTVGNEVRTFLPEPTTGALLGLGLVLVGFVSGIRGRPHRRAIRD